MSQNAGAALDKVIDCAQLLKQTLQHSENTDQIDKGIGELLFAAVGVAVKCEIEPEYSLTKSCNRFIIGFTAVEEFLKEKHLCWSKLTPQELVSVWRQVITEQDSK